MCDFHSVVVNGAGQIFHNESNSHSNIIRSFGLTETADANRFWECEWDGRGAMPVKLVQDRGHGIDPTSVAVRAAERHYEKLAGIMAGTLELEDTAPFNTPEYNDVRNEVNRLKRDKPIQDIIDHMSDMSSSEEIEFLRELIERSSVRVEDVAEDEIQSAEESARESASEDMYSPDYVDEMAKDSNSSFYETVMEHAAEELDTDSKLYQAAYLAGFDACRTGSTPPADYIGGLPAFLFA